MANSKIPQASKVGDVVGSDKITDMWQTHYFELLNSIHDTSSKSFVSEHIDAVSSESIISISSGDVSEGLKDTKMSKSPGIDGLAAEHYVYSHKCLSVHLALLFTCIVRNSWIYAKCYQRQLFQF